MRRSRVPFIFWLLSSFVLGSLSSIALAQENANHPPTFHMTGSAGLLSQYVEHGLSQTNKAPALQGSFWFNFGPQIRLGVWGSNVNFPNEDAHLVLKPTADVRIIFSANTDFVLSYDENKYFSSSDRNGHTLGFHLKSFGYRVNYELQNNWEGTQSNSTYFSLGKTIPIFGTWLWDNEAGYSMLKASGYSNYFDARSFLGYKFSQVLLQGGLTGTSSTTQFHGAGGYCFILAATTEF